MEQIHWAFGLSHRKATITDYLKLLKLLRCFPPSEPDEEQHASPEPDEEEDEEQGVVFTDMEELLGTTEGQFSLSPCNDLVQWHTGVQRRSALLFGQRQAVLPWPLRLSMTSVGIKMIVLRSTRWNSIYNALSRISDIPAHDLNMLCTKLDIRAPTEHKHLFLKEYCSVLEPLTIALDILQGDSYYGALLQTLETLMSKTLNFWGWQQTYWAWLYR